MPEAAIPSRSSRTEGETLSGTFSIDADQPVFAGHFPGRPILPGVFILRFLRAVTEQHLGRALVTRGMKKVKFVRPVVPPCRLDLEGTLRREEGPEGVVLRFDCEAKVDGAVVLEGRLEYTEA